MTATIPPPSLSPPPLRYWLMKSEPADCSIDDLAARPQQPVPWVGVRNYQARNFMRDTMQVGDLAFFYHSSCPQPGIVGIVQISSTAYTDTTQFDPHSKYFDPLSKPDVPRWQLVDVLLVRKLPLISLAQLRDQLALADLRILQRGNRLSITPVDAAHWEQIIQLSALQK